MAFPRQKDPLEHMLAYLASERKKHAGTLALGAWEGEAKARELVGRLKSINDIQAELEKTLGPHSQYLEQDLTS